MKATTLHPGCMYVCTNLNCKRTAEFISSPSDLPRTHRCLCGSPMKRAYSSPELRFLSKEEAYKRLSEASKPESSF